MNQAAPGRGDSPGLPTVWADESSWTGENLLDPQQPVYALGSVRLDDAHAVELVERARAALPRTAGEPKFTTLANSRAGRDALLRALAALPDGAARVYVAHKRYMVAAKIIDLLVEPLAHEAGWDMYADGSALGFANLLHAVGPVLGDANAYEGMLAAFVSAVRGRATATLDELYEAIEVYLATCSNEWRGDLTMLAASRAIADDLLRMVRSGALHDSLDPAVPCLVALCRDLGERVGRFRLVHDESNVLARHALELLRVGRLEDVMRPGQRLEPRPAVEIEFERSDVRLQLQVADWVAGAARLWATSLVTGRDARSFSSELAPLVRPWLAGGVWPDTDAIAGLGRG